MKTMNGNAKKRNQNVLIVLSHLFGKMGSSVFIFGMGLMILRETGSATDFAFTQMVGPIVSLLLIPFTGSIVDKSDFKVLAISAQLASVVGLILFWLGYFNTGFPKLIMVYTLLIVLSLADLFLELTIGSSLISMVIGEDVQKMMAMKQMVISFTVVITPVLGVLLFHSLSMEWFLVVELAIESIVMIMILFINFYLHKSKQKVTPENESFNSLIHEMYLLFKEGIHYIENHRIVKFTLFYSIITNVLFTSINVGLPFLEIQVFEFTDFEYGLAQSVFAIGIITASLILSQKKDFQRPVFVAWRLGISMFVILLVLGGIIYLELPRIPNLIGTLIVLLLAGGFLGGVNIPLQVRSTKNIPQVIQGRVFNLSSTLLQIFMPIGILVFGLLFDSGTKPEIIFAGAAGLGILGTLLLPLWLKIPFWRV